MTTLEKTSITVTASLNLPVEKVWDFYTNPDHIIFWNNASDDWHAPHAENDLREGGKFTTTMAAKDGSFSFDFGGEYDAVSIHEHISYTMSDGRKCTIDFEKWNTFIRNNSASFFI